MALESWLLETISTVANSRVESNKQSMDGAARYFGETFRKQVGGKWSIDFLDPKNAFYGLPQISGFKGQTTQICPRALVSAAIARGKGDFLFKILKANSPEKVSGRS
jgi:hypothetical protein